MNQNQKKRQLTRGLSVALSLLIVAAVCVTVIAVVSSKREKPNPLNTTGSQGGTETTAPDAPDSTTGRPDPQTPVFGSEVTFISPMTAGNILKEWSAEIPVFSNTMEDYRVHLGVDIGADAGTPVYAAADGTVELVEFDPMMGETVVLSHEGGYRTVYRNLQTKIADGIEAGASVEAGDVLGAVGDTALVEISESPHLHFEICRDDRSCDPLSHVSITPIDPNTDFED